ncbi:hypothetical protein NPIL_30101 [Nephila pilipes]|uniref:Uncharacterized protein n=1 Tax=Nephila pilipes TaxID=299642 RepID=A0A8X6PW26_NEPPI|nr:hypothetical protein NPIL_30101 [Nephila pilipes]
MPLTIDFTAFFQSGYGFEISRNSVADFEAAGAEMLPLYRLYRWSISEKFVHLRTQRITIYSCLSTCRMYGMKYEDHPRTLSPYRMSFSSTEDEDKGVNKRDERLPLSSKRAV